MWIAWKEHAMGLGRFLGRNGDPSKEPDFIRTSRYDGRKSVDFDKFFADPVVKERMEQLREKVVEPRRKRASGS
jgi:hypothetical protein